VDRYRVFGLLATLAICLAGLGCNKEEAVPYGGEVKQAPVAADAGTKPGGGRAMPTVDPNQ